MNSDFGVYMHIPIYIYIYKYIYVYILQGLRKWQEAELGEVEVGNQEKVPREGLGTEQAPQGRSHSSKPVLISRSI